MFLLDVDLFLIGATLLISAVGFYELFIRHIPPHGRFRVPAWLEMRDLNDLKRRVIAMIVLVIAVSFAELAVDRRLRGGRHQIQIRRGFRCGRAKRQLQIPSQRINPRHELEREFFMVTITGAAAEGRQVSAALVIVSPDRGERPLAVAVLAEAPPGWLCAQVQPPRVGTGHQMIELHRKAIKVRKRGSYVQVTQRAISLIRRVEEAAPAGRQVVGNVAIGQAVAQAC